MSTLKYKIVSEGPIAGYNNPLTLALLDVQDIKDCGVSIEQAVKAVAATIPGPAGIDVFDKDTITTTSDGILAECAMVAIAASDRGVVNKDYGLYPMLETPYSPELIEEEPCLAPWQILYKGKRLFRGPDPKFKKNPVHNCVITGRACNNNSGSEIMNLVTMEEMLFPHMGMTSLFLGGEVMVGLAGEIISVGIGMMVPETNGRISPAPLCEAGDTLHNSAEYAKTLKKSLPAVVARKSVLAQHIINELNVGMVVGYNISCSPMNLTVARLLGKPIAMERITQRAWLELDSIGFTREYVESIKGGLSEDEIIANADELLPGMENYTVMKSEDVVREASIEL